MEALIIGASAGVINLIGYELLDRSVGAQCRTYNAIVSIIFGFVMASMNYIIRN